MRTNALVCLLLAGLVLVVPAAAAQPASGASGLVRVTGRILDAVNAQPLPGVTITVDGASVTTVTDLDGRYAVRLAPGTHTVRVSLDGFQPKALRVTVEDGRPLELTTSLAVGGYTETITVSADLQDGATSSVAAQLMERRRAGAISDNMGSSEMKQNADSTAASALQRVTGLSVVDNQYVFVRGLGERYSSTTLNGAVIPSTEPERRVVSLDMFPAGLLDNVSVIKTYTPDRQAEFAGGLVEIMPSRLPNRPMFNLSVEGGANSRTFRKDALDYPGGGTDWLAADDGRRRLPGIVPGQRVIRGGIFTPDLGFSRAQLERFGEAFENLWEPTPAKGRANSTWNAVYGNRWKGFGLLASFNQGQRAQRRDEEQNYYRTEKGGGLSTFSEYDYAASEVKSSWAALLNLGYQFNVKNRLSFQGFSSNSGLRETRQFEGFNADVGRNLRNTRLLWVEENLNTGQLTGEHLFTGLSNSRIEWHASASRSNRDEPDLRETLYEQISGRFRLADESQSGFRMFNDLNEDAIDIGVNWSTSFTNWKGLPTLFKAGPQYTRRQRDFASRRFRFIPLSTAGLDLTQSPSQLFSPANIGPRFELREETRATDFYDARQTLAGGYGMVDVPLSATFRLIGGVRVEQFKQGVDTFDLFDSDVDGDLNVISARIEETDIFPSLNTVWSIRPDQNIRMGFSQTVNRPEFRELAPFEFTDIVGGRAVVGNPELTRALIQNYDARWEWFAGPEEVFAASVFYKNFQDPIERFVEPTSQLRTSFQNAKSARNIGLELEARKLLTRAFLVGANYTFVDSSITLSPSQTNVLTTLRRPLAGTSENLVNGFIEGRAGALTARVLMNYFGNRIADVGSLGLPDILEKGRTTVDLSALYRFRRFTVRFSADNLSDEPIKYTQGGEPQRTFKLGRTLAFQFGFSAF